jgi:phytanoyl-CoA hydroxylase
MTFTTGMLQDDQLESWSENGFFRIEGFAGSDTCKAMLQRVTDIVRDETLAEAVGARVMPENNKAGMAVANPEDGVSKIFRLHRDDVFASFATSDAVTDIAAQLIGPDIDVFLSQFIFKTSGAWGQPWHQDSFYFPFEPARPVVGVWLAVTEATLRNGCLHVLPGSQTEPIHRHGPDSRPGANHGYFEIDDHDMSTAQPVLMDPGDLLVRQRRSSGGSSRRGVPVVDVVERPPVGSRVTEGWVASSSPMSRLAYSSVSGSAMPGRNSLARWLLSTVGARAP